MVGRPARRNLADKIKNSALDSTFGIHAESPNDARPAPLNCGAKFSKQNVRRETKAFKSPLVSPEASPTMPLDEMATPKFSMQADKPESKMKVTSFFFGQQAPNAVSVVLEESNGSFDTDATSH